MWFIFRDQLNAEEKHEVGLGGSITGYCWDSGLHKLLTNDSVFSALKDNATTGYLASEYTTTVRFTEKSDVFAFGMLVFQIISGKSQITNSVRLGGESSRSLEYIDPIKHGKFSEYEAAKLAKIALNRTHDLPSERPCMDEIILEEQAISYSISFTNPSPGVYYYLFW